ncbi:hypothetical protein E2542_SST16552 [Spatholobus suberectus]|nr:hypothetical protein E2542_SST16552 [Spatholobus suberectus]
MASLRFLFLAFFIVLALSCIGEVQASRKLLAPTFPDVGNIPGLDIPPFPPVTDWPEYRLPAPLFPNLPSVPSVLTTFKTLKRKSMCLGRLGQIGV